MILTPQLPPGMKVDPYAYQNDDPYGLCDYNGTRDDPSGDYTDPVSGDHKENLKNAFGVLQRVADRYLRKEQLYREGSVGNRAYYRYKNIQDLGFKKWKEAYDNTFKYIRIASFISFKAWRMSYSFLLGSKQFFCIFQKKKFKKQIVSTTMVSMFMSELLMIVCALVGLIDFKPFDQ